MHYQDRFAFLLVKATALLQIAIALGVLFLPIIQLCGSDGCRQASYFQLNAGILGYVLLLLVSATSSSILVVRKVNTKRFVLRCWLLVAVGLITVYSSWIFGLYFLAGSLLMFIVALWLTLTTKRAIPG